MYWFWDIVEGGYVIVAVPFTAEETLQSVFDNATGGIISNFDTNVTGGDVDIGY
jgi:hypothetical protein